MNYNMYRKRILNLTKLFFTLFFILMMCFSCIPFNGERPIDYPNTRWVSEIPSIYFDIGSFSMRSDLSVDYDAEGVLILENNENIDIVVLFDYVDGVAIRTKNKDGRVFFGKCIFKEDRMIVTPNDKREDTLFNGKYQTITFIKTELGDRKNDNLFV